MSKISNVKALYVLGIQIQFQLYYIRLKLINLFKIVSVRNNIKTKL